jgi:hypothetical protein
MSKARSTEKYQPALRERLVWALKRSAVGGIIRGGEGVLPGSLDFSFAFGEVSGVELRGLQAAGADGEGVIPAGAAIALEETPPGPAAGGGVGGIVPLDEFLLVGGIAGGKEHLAGGPRQFVVMHEEIAVLGELLVGAILAVGGDGICKEGPSQLRFPEVEGGGVGELALEERRGGSLGEGGYGGGGGAGVLGPDDLGVAELREHVVFVRAVAGIDEEVEAAIGVLHLAEEIGFPLGLFEQVAPAVAAFRDSKVIQRACAGQCVGGEDEVVNELGAIDGVLGIIAGVVVAARDVNGTLVDVGIELGGGIFEAGSGLGGIEAGGIVRDSLPGVCEIGLREGNAGGCHVAGGMSKAGVRERIGSAATLVVDPEGVGAGEIHRNAIGDGERERGAEAGNDEAVNAGSIEGAEIGFIDALIGERRVGEARIGALHEPAVIHHGATGCVHEREGGEADKADIHFAEAAEIIADHCLFRARRHVPFLVHVDGGAVAEGIGGGGEDNVRGPEGGVGSGDGHRLAIGDGAGEFEVDAVVDTEVADGKGA